MPIIEYTVQVKDGQPFTETDTYEATADPKKTVEEETIKPWNEHGEGDVTLLSVRVINPFIHLHSWRLYKKDQYTNRALYQCQRCKITGYKRLELLRGEIGGITRNPDYQNKKYDLCRDPLTKMPKTIFG